MSDELDVKRLLGGELDLTQSDFSQLKMENERLAGRNLAGSNLQSANIESTDFAVCSFDQATLVNSTFTNCSFERASLRMIGITNVKFIACDFRKASFRQSVFAGQNDFTGSDFRGANFTMSQFNDLPVLSDAKFDADTDFEGARGKRAVARSIIFQHFEWKEGVFHRKPDTVGSSPENTGGAVLRDIATAEVLIGTGRAAVEMKLRSEPVELQQMAAAIAQAIEEQIVSLQHNKPNDEDDLNRHVEYVTFLEKIARALNALARDLGALQETSQPQVREEEIKRLSGVVVGLRDHIGNWWEQNQKMVVDFGFQTGLVGVGCAFLNFCGVPAWEAFPALASLVGGSKLAEGVKAAKAAKSDS
jgi:uncharacterized protein YjbI with pentapeptide repeats